MAKKTIKHVTFATPLVDQRFAKISYALRKRGISTSIISNFCGNSTGLERFFDTAIQLRDGVAEFTATIQNLSTDLFVINWTEFDEKLKAFRGLKKPIIFDYKDILPGHVGALKAEQLQNWVSALEFQRGISSGVMCRDWQYSSYCRFTRTNDKRKILFPDFCWSSDLLPASSQGMPEGKVLAFIGNFTVERDKPFDAAHGNIFVFRKLIDLGAEIRHWPFNHGRADLSDYFELSRRSNAAYTIMPKVDPISLLTELSQCDFGVFAIQGYHFPELNLRSRNHARYIRWGISARIFDYLSAGLPVAESSLRHSSYLMKRFGVGVQLDRDLGNFGSFLSSYNVVSLRKNADIARRTTLNMDTHVGNLIDWFTQI